MPLDVPTSPCDPDLVPEIIRTHSCTDPGCRRGIRICAELAGLIHGDLLDLIDPRAA